MRKRITLTEARLSEMEKSVKRLLVSSREALRRTRGQDFVRRFRFYVNEPDYCQAYGIVFCLFLLGFLDSTIEVQDMFSRWQDEVLAKDGLYDPTILLSEIPLRDNESTNAVWSP